MDDFDLRNNLSRGDSIWETADFLMRDEAEVEARAKELGLSFPRGPSHQS